MEELLESEAVEVAGPEPEEAVAEPTARPLPAPAQAGNEVSVWREDVRTAALAAAGGLVAGAATVAVVRASRSNGSRRRPARRASRRQERPANVIASRSFLVDVHLLGDK